MPDYSKATELATEVAEKATAKSNRAWIRENLELVEKGLSDKTYLAYVQMLNDECGFDISESVFGNYLSDARKARNANPKTQKQTAKKISSEPDRVASPDGSAGQEAPAADWTELEKLVGYRLSDEIRDYVSADGKRVVENFPKPTMLSSEIRAELTKLRRDLKRI